jgi:hypothetical protein
MAMSWQDVAVWIVVAAAVIFLVGRNLTIGRKKRPAQTFVPLSAVKKRSSSGAASSDPHDACH